ncbi:MAG TPA: hypothetical protein VG326_09230 [Tepidisphaeraceae bacterium]|jgi:hypothetical protein|nr:hypothetical protein [Tepidisphaeraceae bacterium]
MDKVKNFLERHVQWLVLAIALLYVGYTVWNYIWLPPLAVNIGPVKTVKPGDVDETIDNAQVKPLLKEIDNKTVTAPKVTDVLSEFDDRLNERRTEIVRMNNLWDAPFADPGTHHLNQGGGAIVKVNVLPTLPPAVFKAQTIRRTVVMAPGRKDTAYWSGKFTIDSNALAQAVAAAFNKPGIPPNLFRTEFVQVELLREEQSPSGTWSAPLTIKPLAILQPLPADSAPLDEKFNFQHWMDQNQASIAHPPFLPTAPDVEPWLEPGAAPPAVGAGRGAGQPGASRPGGNPAAVGAEPPAANPDGQPGGFNAILQPADPTIIVHDTTIEEGKTYRYSVKYKLYNPLFNNRVFATPDIAAQFAISGPDPIAAKDAVAWSGPAAIEPSTYVFATKINQFTGQAWFDVFEWKDGRWHWTKSLPVKPLTPGDPIAGAEGVSKFVLVDVRKDMRNTEPSYAIAMDGNGMLQSRNARDDAADPKYATLKLQAVGPGPAAAIAR